MPQYRRPTLAQIAYSAFDARVEAHLRDGADPAAPETDQPSCENCEHAYATHHFDARPIRGCTLFDCSCTGYVACPTLDDLLTTDTRYGTAAHGL